jgi:hypothetical protein
MDVLHPVRAVVARHDHAQGIAVEPRQVGAVHRPRQQDLAVARVVDVERLDEVGRRSDHRLVEAVEHDLARPGLDAGLVEHGLERHALPARVAHRAVAELAARDARLEEPAAVARALVDRDDLGRRHRPELGERQRQRLCDLAADLEPEAVRIDLLRDAGEVVADEERVAGRDRSLVEHAERRLELRRALGEPDHRPLLRVLDQRPLAVRERQGRRLGPRPPAEQLAGGERGGEASCTGHEVTPVEHRSPPLAHAPAVSRRNFSGF